MSQAEESEFPILAGGISGCGTERPDEGRGIFVADEVSDVFHGEIWVLEKDLRPRDPESRQIGMRRQAGVLFECADKIELGEQCAPREIVERERVAVVRFEKVQDGIESVGAGGEVRFGLPFGEQVKERRGEGVAGTGRLIGQRGVAAGKEGVQR